MSMMTFIAVAVVAFVGVLALTMDKFVEGTK